MGRNKLSRRQFVTTLSAGAGSLILANAVNAVPFIPAAASADPLQLVKLGKAGIKTTMLGMGTGFSGYNRSSNITRAGVAESLIRQAYEKGVRFFDCADSYGTHPYTAAAL
ncbi:MAG: twin-arginine translocation signal domain-containing protein, partial [Bacteroidales bacterium]|nr:twin-arginine translocation signal domain-containing protein [Bacteroidales bacterium]